MKFIALFILTGLYAAAQTPVAHRTFLDYRTETPRTIANVKDTVYVAYDGGDVFMFDERFEPISQALDLERLYIDDLLEYADHAWALSLDKRLFVRDDSGSWGLYAQCTGYPYRDSSGTLHIIIGNTINKIIYDGVAFSTVQIASVPDFDEVIATFAVVNDTVIYGFVNSKRCVIRSMDGAFNNTQLFDDVIQRFYALDDGSVLIERDHGAIYSIAKGTLWQPQYKLITVDGKGSTLTFVSAVTIHDTIGVIGLYNMGVNTDSKPLLVTSSGGITGVPQLETISVRTPMFCRDTTAWIAAASPGTLQRLTDDGNVITKKFLPGIEEVLSDGPMLYKGTYPGIMGTTIRNQKKSPAWFGNDGSGQRLHELDTTYLSSTAQLMGYYNREGLAECAILEDTVLFREHSGVPWSRVYTMQPRLYSWRDITILNMNNILSSRYWNGLILSMDKGKTWTKHRVLNMWNGPRHAIDGGDCLYVHDADTVRQIRYSELADTIKVPSYTLNLSPYFMFEYADSDKVRFINFKSTTDTVFNPYTVDKIVSCVWDVSTQKFDSSAVLLDVPLDSELEFTRRADTTLIWCWQQSRFLRLYKGELLQDVIVNLSDFKSFERLQVRGSIVDSLGRWWLMSSVYNCAVAIDTRYNQNVSSIEDYYHVYIHKVFPNPANNNNLSITLGRFSDAVVEGLKLQVVDLQGMIVKDFTQHVRPFPSPNSQQTISVDIADIQSGSYLLVVKNKQVTHSMKFVIER